MTTDKVSNAEVARQTRELLASKVAEAAPLPWNERIVMLSIHPDAATRDDVARLASELMEANAKGVN